MPREDFIRAIQESSSFKEALSHFGLENVGGNYRTLQTRMQAEGLEDMNFRCNGRASMIQALKNFNSQSTPLSKVMVEGSSYSRGHLKKRLLREGILKNICSKCGLGTEWKGEPLTLVIDHINGIRNDHRLENLRILCPNCNSQTKTFAGRRSSPHKCIDCGTKIGKKSIRCKDCASRNRIRPTKIQWPSHQELFSLVAQNGYLEAARELGVSDTAVRKRLTCRGVVQLAEHRPLKSVAGGSSPSTPANNYISMEEEDGSRIVGSSPTISANQKKRDKFDICQSLPSRLFA